MQASHMHGTACADAHWGSTTSSHSSMPAIIFEKLRIHCRRGGGIDALISKVTLDRQDRARNEGHSRRSGSDDFDRLSGA